MEIGSSVRATTTRGAEGAVAFVEGIVIQVTSTTVSVLDRLSGDIHTLPNDDWKVVRAVFTIPQDTLERCHCLGCILDGDDGDRPSLNTRSVSNPSPRLDVVDVDTLPLTSLVTHPACTPHDAVSVAIRHPSVGALCTDGDDGGLRLGGCVFTQDDAVGASVRRRPVRGDTNSALWWDAGSSLPVAGSTVALKDGVEMTLTTLGAVLEKAVRLGTGAVVAVCKTTTGDVAQFASTIASCPPAIGGDPLRFIMLPQSVVCVLARDVMLTVDDVRCRQVFEKAVDTGEVHALLAEDKAFGGACATTSSAVVAMATQHEGRVPLTVIANGWEYPEAAAALAHCLSDTIKPM